MVLPSSGEIANIKKRGKISNKFDLKFYVEVSNFFFFFLLIKKLGEKVISFSRLGTLRD